MKPTPDPTRGTPQPALQATAITVYLWLCAGIILAVALAYGLMLGISMPALFGMDVVETDRVHMLRATAGPYVASAALWIAGTLHPALLSTALKWATLFMLGLTAGRMVSMVVDGLPHPLFIAGSLVELALGLSGLLLLRKSA